MTLLLSGNQKSVFIQQYVLDGLPDAFNMDAKPWINVKAATIDELINQVKQCPSGAISYYMNKEDDK